MNEAQPYEPDSLIKYAAKHGELVVFVGAGASMLCGSPDWRGFANQVVDLLEKSGALSFLEAEQLRGLGDSRRSLSIAMALAKEKDVAIDFGRILHPSRPAAIGVELYELLSSLRPVFVTTNYDKWLDDAGPEELSADMKVGGESEPATRPGKRPTYYLREQLSPALLAERGAVIHLHGSYLEPSSMVVSLKDYIECYADARVQAFLSAMFKNYTVLFVGYGLAELEILEYVIRSNASLRTENAEPRHFLLYACRSIESVQTRFLKKFYREQCGIRIIRYYIDTKGYQEIVDVFKSWKSELDIRDPTTLDLQLALDGYIAEPNTVNRDAAFRLVRNRIELTSYFVNSLKDAIWFSDLDRNGFFDAKYNPKVKVVKSERSALLYQADGWPALRYLEQIAASAQGDQAIRIAGIVRAISSDAQQRGLENWRTWWSLATVLSQLPLNVVTDSDVDMTRAWLGSRFNSDMVGEELGEKLLPRLLDSSEPANWRKAMLLVDALSMMRHTEAASDKVGVLGSYQLGEVLKTSARKLGERCGAAAVDTLAHRLAEYIGLAEEDNYSYIWRPAIEDHEQNAHRDDTRAVLVEAVRDAALGATSSSSLTALAIAKSLLQSPYPTVVRVGIYTCGEHYGIVGESFWECVEEKWFLDIPYWHELYWLIKKAFSKFSATHRAQFLGFVERLKGNWTDVSRQEELDETHKRDLLYPAFGQGDAEVDKEYQALVQRWGPVREHPDFHMYSTGVSVGDRSPVASDVLVEMSGTELVAYLKGFKPEARSWDGPTYRGLASSITAAVRASEDGFAQRIGLFAELARPYQHGLLRGLKERWCDDKRDVNWQATLSLVRTIVSSPALRADLTADPPEGWEPSVHWVVSDIADLFKGASEIEHHMPPEFYEPCLEVLGLVLNAIPTRTGQTNDAIFQAINSPRGRALESFICVALAMRREEVAAKLGSNETWAIVGPVFDAELGTSEFGSNLDFSALAGMYCVNFQYLNPEWTETNFDRIFSSTNDAAWQCAAQGFAYQRNLYDWLFKHLARGGHLRKMIYSEGLPKQVAEKALQFLGLAYLEGLESLDESGLLSELVADLKVRELSHLCWFFWTLRGKAGPSDHTSKILAFWWEVAKQVRAKQANVPELQSALSQLAVFVYDLTPATVEMLVDAAPYAQVGHHGSVLVENLARLASQYPKEVAAIFRAAITSFLPEYPKEGVIGCVNQLAEAGEFEEAEWICNAYAERGSILLKKTYEALRANRRPPP